MSDAMGTFRTEWIPDKILELLGIERRKVWRFRQADGTVLERA